MTTNLSNIAGYTPIAQGTPIPQPVQPQNVPTNFWTGVTLQGVRPPRLDYAVPLFRKLDRVIGKVITKVSNVMNNLDDRFAESWIGREIAGVPHGYEEVMFRLNKDVVRDAVEKSMARQRALTITSADIDRGVMSRASVISEEKMKQLEKQLHKLERLHLERTAAQATLAETSTTQS